MNSNVKKILAVDIGGSKVVAGFVDPAGNTSHLRKFLWTNYDRNHVISTLCQTIRDLLAESETRPDAIGFTTPGFADPENGIWLSGSYMGIFNVPLRDIIEQEFRIPVFVENDTNACCLAEKLFGSCREDSDFLYMTVSNGVGGSLFLDNRLYYGRHGLAGEYGMCVVKEGGVELEHGGIAGCLEMYASGRGLIRNYLECGGQPLIDGQAPDGKSIAAQADAGEPAALQAFDLEGQYIGKVIAAACNLLDPGKVIIGGGLSLTFDKFYPALNRTMKKEHFRLENYTSLVSIEPTTLGYYGGLYGAAAAALLGCETDPAKKLGYRG